MNENELSRVIIGSCIRIHKALGPGLLENVYEAVLNYELTKIEGLTVQRQMGIPVKYQEVNMELGFRADLIVENKVLIELKSVDSLHDVHKKQTLTYLKLTGVKLGLLINFNESLLKDGIVRIVNNL